MIGNGGPISEKQNLRPAWTRLLDIVLRSAHVLVISALFGGVVFRIPLQQLLSWQYLAVASGVMLIASEVAHHWHWPAQARGGLVFIHAGLFVLACVRPNLALPCLSAALVLGMAGSHMPKKLRYWPFIRSQGKD